MNVKFAVSLGSALLFLNLSGFALDPEKQAMIDRYKEPFAVYLAAINALGTALESLDNRIGSHQCSGQILRPSQQVRGRI